MGAHVETPLFDLHDAEMRAEQSLDPATFAFIAAGAGDEVTRGRNRAAFARWGLLPRALEDVSEVRSDTEVLGRRISMPVLVAPMGLQRIVHRDGECAMARGVAAAETIMCVSTVSTRSPAEIASTGVARWFQLSTFAERSITDDLIAQARESGYEALIVTVDGAVIGRRERALRAGFSFGPEITIPSCGRALGLATGADPVRLGGMLDRSLTWEKLERLACGGRLGLGGARAPLPPLPLVVKGILSPADAGMACEHGAAAVVVSNHGGRQLDGTPATLDMLPAVVEAGAGRAEGVVGGGVRRG